MSPPLTKSQRDAKQRKERRNSRGPLEIRNDHDRRSEMRSVVQYVRVSTYSHLNSHKEWYNHHQLLAVRHHHHQQYTMRIILQAQE
jgi:hypothetical protein